MLSETKRKTERKARYTARTAGRATAQCARRQFSEGLAHAMFLLAVLSRNQIIIHALALKKKGQAIERYWYP